MNRLDLSGEEWRMRAEYWSTRAHENPREFRKKRRDRRALIICGHGARLSIDRDTLLVCNGFTHYPQQREECRYFPGDPNLPARILVVDASGSISFDVLRWLAEQKIPLIQINWRGSVTAIANADYCSNPKMVSRQRRIVENDRVGREMTRLISEKFENSLLTLNCIPKTGETAIAIKELRSALAELGRLRAPSVSQLLGLEGKAAAAYFDAWKGIPINWRLLRRDIIPKDWHVVGSRRSPLSKSNRNARHPVNAMLNYAYTVLYAQVRIKLIAEGYDPTLGLFHAKKKYRDALVLDHMEPLRPIVDAVILKMILHETFTAADFTITKEGFCRLNSQLARTVCGKTIEIVA